MSTLPLKRCVACLLVPALAGVFSPALAAPTTATLTGIVFTDDVRTPLAGVTVVLTDGQGERLLATPTGADGRFTIKTVEPGNCNLSLETPQGSFPIATPVTLAPGQTRGVHVALKARADEDEKKKKKGAGYVPNDGKGLGAMIAVLVGFVAAAAVAINQSNDESDPPASPSSPED